MNKAIGSGLVRQEVFEPLKLGELVWDVLDESAKLIIWEAFQEAIERDALLMEMRLYAIDHRTLMMNYVYLERVILPDGKSDWRRVA